MRLIPATLALALALSTFTMLGPAAAENRMGHHPDTGVPDGQVIVAVIDTGIDGNHPEFGGYRGQAGVTDPQIVAWYDFGQNGVPAPGVTWDPATPVPYDSGHSGNHGTGTASLVGGAAVGAYPGVKLAIAKITNSAGSLVHIDAAIEWAAKTVGADVISMSFGTIIPVAGVIDGTDEAVHEAFLAGALPVIAAGNGIGNVGIKYPSETDSPAYSPYALVVGAGAKSATTTGRSVSGSFSNTDPDVISWGVSVQMATAGGGYRTSSGTSYSTPLVAGWSALVMQAALDNGQPADPARIEQLVAWTADDDPLVPYAIEGFGYVGDGLLVPVDSVTDAVAHAAAGSIPGAPAAGNQAGHAAAQALRVAASETAELAAVVHPLGMSSPGSLRASAPHARDADAYRVTLGTGDVVEVTVEFTAPDGVDDIDVWMYRPGAGSAGVFSDNDVVAHSAGATQPGPNTETFRYRAAKAGDHLFTVEGWLVGAAGATYTLEVKVNGATVPATFLGDHLATRPL